MEMSMKILFRLVPILAIFCLALGISNADSAQDQSAEDYLMSYINTLNTRDYAAAYRMMDNHSDSYTDFAAGYEHTLRIIPYFGSSGAAAGSSYITTILIGYQDDGSIETYYGYFQLHSGQLYSPVRNNGGWVLSRGHFILIAENNVLSNATMRELLEAPWNEAQNFTNLAVPTAELNTDKAAILLYYYDQINQGYYTNAYNIWLGQSHGLSRSYALPYTDFVAGYGDTRYVTVYLGTSQALNPPNYRLDYLPAVLVAEHTDGSFESFSGCYAMMYISTGGIGIANGSFRLLSEEVPTSEELFEALENLNCAGLRIGL
jgi:hypothetical protein